MLDGQAPDVDVVTYRGNNVVLFIGDQHVLHTKGN